MQKWEYLYVVRGTEQEYAVNGVLQKAPTKEAVNTLLNRFGAEGWELVAIQSSSYYFKRPMQE